MIIKISSFYSLLHESNDFDFDNDDFMKELSNALGEKIIYAPLEDYNCDIKLILIASGGSENLFLSNIEKLKEPFYLLTTGKNNSLAASLEILTYLNNNNLKGEILHGSANYIASRIIKLATKQDYTKLVNLGVIGSPSDWLISSTPNYKNIEKAFGIKLIDIDLKEVIDAYNSINDYDPKLEGFDNKELNKANNFYLATKKIVDKYNLEGFTIRCFSLLNTICTTGCLSLAKMNASGIIGTCEGDIIALVCMYLIRKWFNTSSFQANPSRIDVDNREIDLAHCTCPFDMLDSFMYDTHFESGIGVAIKGEFRCQDVTVFRLSSNLKNYFVAEGKILTNLNDKRQCRSQIRIKVDDDISSLLTEPCGNHHLIFYGHHKDDIIKRLSEVLKG